MTRHLRRHLVFHVIRVVILKLIWLHLNYVASHAENITWRGIPHLPRRLNYKIYVVKQFSSVISVGWSLTKSKIWSNILRVILKNLVAFVKRNFTQEVWKNILNLWNFCAKQSPLPTRSLGGSPWHDRRRSWGSGWWCGGGYAPISGEMNENQQLFCEKLGIRSSWWEKT